ncbi:MAG: pantetheine-phosphate adenylyltransferase [Spirochaetia bacterium]
MFKVLLPGTFDPPTNGHLNILRRASHLFDAVEVVIAVNPGKRYLFSAAERLAMMIALSEDLPNVTVTTWNGLIVDFADKIGVHVIVRGVRALADFDYEFELSVMNRSLNPRIETIFLPTDQKYSVIRSSAIKEIAGFGGDISGMVPPNVAKALRVKLHAGGAGAPQGGDGGEESRDAGAP